MMRKSSLFAASVLAATIGAGASAQTGEGVKAGFLTCNVDSGWGFVFGSSRQLKCTYSPKPGVTELYMGTIAKFGVDIGYQHAAVIVWAVIAPTSDVGRGALAGNFVGVTGSAAVGPGVGANVLVGGSNKTITLQPVSIEGVAGLNVAGGIAALDLVAEKS